VLTEGDDDLLGDTCSWTPFSSRRRRPEQMRLRELFGIGRYLLPAYRRRAHGRGAGAVSLRWKISNNLHQLKTYTGIPKRTQVLWPIGGDSRPLPLYLSTVQVPWCLTYEQCIEPSRGDPAGFLAAPHAG
jgi:hypothetical protein